MMQRRRFGAEARGVTLPELVIAMVVMVAIIAVISAIYTVSMRAWLRGATEDYAQQKAAWAIQRIGPDVRAGMAATPMSPPYNDIGIAIQEPARTYSGSEGVYLNQVSADGEGHPYLVPGGWVLYYRGDDNGNLALDGTKLWRREISGAGSIVRQQAIADNIVDNPKDATGHPKPMFIYWPDIYRLRSVEVTVTVRETQGHKTAQATMNGEIALRNN
jgi:type II secretory pathway pseudopilin PulG